MNERAVTVSFSLPTSAERPEVVVPTARAFHNPAARLSKDTANQWWLAAPADVRTNAALTRLDFWVLVVVALVEADVLRTPWSARPEEEHGVESGAHHPFVVNVGPGQRDRQRNAVTVRQNVTFCAEFSAIGGTWAREVPPFGAFTEWLSSDVHSKSRPTFV